MVPFKLTIFNILRVITKGSIRIQSYLYSLHFISAGKSFYLPGTTKGIT
jgi:hypothetical protein